MREASRRKALRRQSKESPFVSCVGPSFLNMLRLGLLTGIEVGDNKRPKMLSLLMCKIYLMHDIFYSAAFVAPIDLDCDLLVAAQ